MSEPGAGITFSETMSGVVTLAGAGDGKPQALAMHAVIRIDDVAAFVRNPDHKGGLSGRLDFAPFGKSIPADSGVFGLFTPSGDPSLTYMVYELGFRHAGASYYLAGKKHVRIGPVWRLWRETTTLYCELHAGDDATGAVIGSGTLRLGAWQLFKLLCSLRAIHARGLWKSAAAIWQFFAFFSAELLRTYVLRRPRAEKAQ